MPKKFFVTSSDGIEYYYFAFSPQEAAVFFCADRLLAKLDTKILKIIDSETGKQEKGQFLVEF